MEGYSNLLQSVQVCLSSAIICYYCPNGHYSELRKHCRPLFRGPERSACPESGCLCALVNHKCHASMKVLVAGDEVQGGHRVRAANQAHSVGTASHGGASAQHGMAGEMGGPLGLQGGGGWDAAPGGVGVLYSLGMAMQVASRRQVDEDAQALWHSTRWLHVHLVYARGKSILTYKWCQRVRTA